jgi:hypothetical protein
LEAARGPELSNAFKGKILALSTTATCMPLSEGTNATTMNNCLLCVAAELNVPIAVGKVPEDLLFWRSADDDLQQAKRGCTTFANGPAHKPGPSRPPSCIMRRIKACPQEIEDDDADDDDSDHVGGRVPGSHRRERAGT